MAGVSRGSKRRAIILAAVFIIICVHVEKSESHVVCAHLFLSLSRLLSLSLTSRVVEQDRKRPLNCALIAIFVIGPFLSHTFDYFTALVVCERVCV